MGYMTDQKNCTQKTVKTVWPVRVKSSVWAFVSSNSNPVSYWFTWQTNRELYTRTGQNVFTIYPAGGPAGSCILLVSSFFFFFLLLLLTQAHAMRLCSVSLKFFNFFLSTTLSNVSTKCLNQFWWNLVTMTNDQARRCPMTFDPVKGHSRSKGSKINIFSKTHQVQQVSWYVHNTHTHDSLQCPLQKLWD